MGAEVFETTTAAVDRTPGRILAVAGQLRSRQRASIAVVPVSAIRRNPAQPRKIFDPERLEELAASIRERGLLQPIILRRQDDGTYLLMAGERRLRAAEIAEIASVPALIRQDDPLEIALIENLQREDLTPLEEAEALQNLLERGDYTHKTLADLVGKSRPYVSNTLTLVRLPLQLREQIAASEVDVSRELLIALARQPTPEAQGALWSRIKLSQLSVRSYRQSPDGATQSRPPRSLAAEILNGARRFNRALRAFDWEQVNETERPRLQRALARIERRLGRVMAAWPET